MALENLLGTEFGLYVGLAADASIVKVYNEYADATADTDDRLVSVAYLSVLVQDYEEAFSIGAGLEHDADTCEACPEDTGTDA